MLDVKIFISCHKESFVPDFDLFIPVQAGTKHAKRKFSNMHHDDDGENISEKNKNYCELTVQYWAWKNVKADYYGFFHYRRYLSFQKEYPVAADGTIEDNYVLPYREIPDIKEELTSCGYERKRILRVVEKADVISIIRERSNFTAYDQYCQFHFKKNLDLMLRIVKEMYPSCAASADTYMRSREIYFMNMYIMKKEYFTAYMEWLFPLLEEFERRADLSEYSESEQRVVAYLAERLFGIYYTDLKERKAGRFCELPYVIFGNTAPYSVMRPVFRQRAVPVVMASNRNFVPYLSVMLRSLMDTSSVEYNYDIMILHCDIDAQLQETVKSIGGGKKNISIRFCNCAGSVKGISFRVHHHFSVETFYRYFILDLLEGYEKVLYLDADMVVCSDVAELYQEDIAGYYLAAVKDVDVTGAYKSDELQKKYLEHTLGLKKPLDYFQAGVLLMNLKKMKKDLNSGEMVKLTISREWQMVDQDVLNIICEGKVKFLPQSWNVLINWRSSGKSRMDRMKQVPYPLWCDYLEARRKPKIIHYAGGWKPWNTPLCDYGEEFWECARKTPFYESMLCDNVTALAYKNVVRESGDKRTFQLRPTRIELVVDMKKLSRLLPAGSRRRMAVRAVFKNWL